MKDIELRGSRSVFLPLIIVAMIGVGCGSDHDGAVGTDRMEQGTLHPTEDGGWTSEKEKAKQDPNTATAADGDDAKPRAERTTGDGTTTTARQDRDTDATRKEKKRDRTRDKASEVDKPDQEKSRAERKASSDELRGLRGKLLAELELARAQLRDGTLTADQRQKHQARAASLAQGLARLDRALDAVDATDATWAQIKTNSDQEVKHLREWMEQNEVKGVFARK